MIPLLDRRSAILLLPYTQGLLSFSALSSPSEQSFLPLGPTVPTANAATAISKANTNASDDASSLPIKPPDLEVFARFIATYTPREILEAVRDSGGKFLYRGEEPNDGVSCFFEKQIITSKTKSAGLLRVCDPPPDLLLPETYDNDPFALDYFQQLEAFLGSTSVSEALPATSVLSIAKPSNGHIATSDPSEAGKWGNVVSIWPLLPVARRRNDNGGAQQQSAIFSYVWPRNQPVFYAPDTLKLQSNKNRKQIDFEYLVQNERLQDALEAADGREVMFSFSTSAAFVTVPIDLDQLLREELETIGYGL